MNLGNGKGWIQFNEKYYIMYFSFVHCCKYGKFAFKTIFDDL